MDFHPHKHDWLLTAGMDGKHTVFDVGKRAVVQEWNTHKKYVVRAKWSADGCFFATASYDHSAALYKLGSGAADSLAQLVKQFHFEANVESLDFTPDSRTLILSVRDDNNLHYISLDTLQDRKVNMNANRDSHVSFTALHITGSLFDGKYVLISTDRDRLILLHAATSKHARVFYGASNDALSQPRHCLDPTASILYSTSQDHTVVLWDVASTRALSPPLKHHKNTIVPCACTCVYSYICITARH